MHYLQREFAERTKSGGTVLGLLQSSALDGLWYLDLEDRAQEWRNNQFWRALGYDPAVLPLLPTGPGLTNADDQAESTRRIDAHLADPGTPYDQVLRYRHQDGRTVHLRRRGAVLRDDKGNATRMLGTHTDVTHERETEALLKSSQQAARIGTWSVDLRGGSIHWDEMTKEIHQVSADFVPQLSEAMNFYKAGTSRETIARLFDRAVREGESFDTELQLVTAEGNDIWVRSIGQPEMKDGECIRVHGIFQDINLRRREEERVINYSILDAKSKEMEQFAYIASHDLREPLLTIEGFLEVIREDFAETLPVEVMSYMRTITGATKRMDELIKGLLDYSRLSAIKQLQEVNLKELFEIVMTDLNSAMSGVNIEFSYTDLPLVMGYPLELKVLFQNLVGNAIKYRRVDERLMISATCADTELGWQINIKDNGIGIAQKDLTTIFKLYRQLHGKGKYTGNGIGLANCMKIVELHGGDIWVESELGQGSTFHFTILTREELEEG
ncbi:sensor histidine kinase [Neolewinella antarctica]|uniref:histidine kinase n=1 Tax=Neolewinella antarctica TaxID=442734 RepID=A0ABX0XBK6_9BACT|nr:ATP-binding protein [Neolewinella antarctica]NJC26361.1 PAS domain S-box-containing protein [Neolewinella antarctica]